MPFSGKKFAIYLLTIIAIVFSLLLIFIFILSKTYVANKVESLVVDFSREKGYEVKIGDIAFGFLAGLEAKDIEILDRDDPDAYQLKIGKLTARPDIKSSIIGRRLEIEGIVVDDTNLSLTEAGFDKLKDLVTEIGQESLEKKEERVFPIGLKKIELNRAEIEVFDWATLYISKLGFRLRDQELEDRKDVDIKGNITISDNDIYIDGFIKTSPNETKGELSVNVAELNLDLLSKVSGYKGGLSLNADLNFQIADRISSRGEITLEDGEEYKSSTQLLSAEILYFMTYDKISDTLLIDSFDFKIGDLFIAKFDGGIERITGDGVFNVNGSAYTDRLEDLTNLFEGFSNIVVSGNIGAQDLKLIGSLKKDDVTLSGNAVLSEVNVKDSERDLEINQLGGNLNFKKVISRGESNGLSIRGKFDSKNVLTKIGVFEDLDGELEFKTDSGWNGSKLSFSLNDLNLKIDPKDKISISELKTTEPINISFDPAAEESLGDSGNQLRTNEITFTSRGLIFDGASFKGYVVEKGEIDDFMIRYGFDGELHVDFNGSGSGLSNKDEGIFVNRILFNLSSDDSGEFLSVGKVALKDGRYGDLKFPSLTSDYMIGSDLIKLIRLKAKLEGLGEVRADEAVMTADTKGGKASNKIKFSQGSFSGPQYGIESRGIGGEFMFYNGTVEKRVWDGKVFVDEMKIRSQTVQDMSLKLGSSSGGGISVEDLKGSVLGGRLGGNLLINMAKPRSLISSSLMIENAGIPYGSHVFYPGRMVFNFRGSFDGDSTPQGKGELNIERLRIGDYEKTSGISSRVKFQTIGETLLFTEGFIGNGGGEGIEFWGRIENLLEERRALKINLSEIPLPVAKDILDPFLPEWIRDGELRGNAMLEMGLDHVLNGDVSWSGKLSIADASFSGSISGVPMSVNGLRGIISFNEYTRYENPLLSALRGSRRLDRTVFRRFLSLLRDSDPNGKDELLRIDEIRYGFLRLHGTECALGIGELEININRCASNLFDGRIYLAGVFDNDLKEDKYNISVLLEDISLEDISNRANSIKDYITGRINGLVWISGDYEDLNTIDGLFALWSIKSKQEKRRLGKAFLEKLGAKSRFFLGSTRRYDSGEISGYIKDGVLTFSEFDISNRILGYKNLSIKVDPRKNTISLAHMLSVIREVSKRASEGRLEIDREN